MMLTIILVCLVSYIFGSIPTAFIIGKFLKGIDIREYGSGNVGATNVFRVVGKKWGIVALVFDIIKGILPVVALTPFIVDFFPVKIYASFLVGFFAVCGHNWTIFLKFRGGKGVATTAGVVCAVFPKAFIITLLIFFIIVFITKYVSLGSVFAALIFPVNLYLFYSNINGFKGALVVSIIFTLLIIYRHKANMKRLLKGEEKKII